LSAELFGRDGEVIVYNGSGPEHVDLHVGAMYEGILQPSSKNSNPLALLLRYLSQNQSL